MQVHTDERGKTCAAFLADTVAWCAAQGIVIERAMTDSATNHTVVRDLQKVLEEHRIGHKRIRAFRPQTNGRIERFSRTLVHEFADARIFTGNRP